MTGGVRNDKRAFGATGSEGRFGEALKIQLMETESYAEASYAEASCAEAAEARRNVPFPKLG